MQMAIFAFWRKLRTLQYDFVYIKLQYITLSKVKIFYAGTTVMWKTVFTRLCATEWKTKYILAASIINKRD